MDQFTRLFASMTVKQRVSILVAVAVVIATIVSVSRWDHERDFRPLYQDLSQEDAASVLAKVRESGTEFRLSENGSTVLVPSSRVAELRLQLAAAGVPKNGRIGFELFDKTNFGTSDFAEQVNYHRALEGELERSVVSLSAVEQARVHISFPKDSIFLESRQPAKASVLVKLRAGAKLSPQNVAAICQLTASAVEGLAPEAVSLVDMHGNLLNRPRRGNPADDSEASEAALDYQQKIEHDLVAQINSTLEPLLGAGKFRAAVFADCDFSSGDQSEETFNPDKSVMVSSQRTEEVSGANLASGVPGTPSNLPRPTSRPGTSGSGISRRTENIGYQSSRVVRHVRLPQGAIKRISVSLIVDHSVRWEGSGAKAKRIVEAPSAEKLKSIHDLVAGVVGFNAQRGDQLIVESLPFDSTLNPEPVEPLQAAPPPAAPQPTWPPSWRDLIKDKKIMIGAGGALVLILVLTIAVRIFRPASRSMEVTGVTPQLPAGAKAGSEDDIAKKIEATLAERAALKQQQEVEALNALKLPPVTTKKAEVLAKHVAEQASKDVTGAAQVLRTWINENNPER